MRDEANSTRKRDAASDEPLKITRRPTVAAGLPAIYQTMRFELREMGPIRAFKTLLSMNQKTGFE